MEFRTNRLSLAAYLLATKSLTLLRIENQDPNAVLIFDDPNNQGPDLELSFTSGEALVPAVSYHAHLRSLRRKIESAMASQRGKQ
jgi:hypothetical protein